MWLWFRVVGVLRIVSRCVGACLKVGDLEEILGQEYLTHISNEVELGDLNTVNAVLYYFSTFHNNVFLCWKLNVLMNVFEDYSVLLPMIHS
nr:hypothetical transcript [Hymenolepis microstoma]